MLKLIDIIKEKKNDGKKVYLRGFSIYAFYLSICLDIMNISFEGYYDADPQKTDKLDYNGRKCFKSSDVDENVFVLCVVQNKEARSSISAEYSAKNVEFVFIDLSDIKNLFYSVDDEKFLKLYYKMIMGKPLNLDEPKTLCEKIQWLKLYDRNPLYTKLADKYEVKKYVADKIGEKYLVPNYGVWDSFDDIDFDSLPEQFILKCTNNSGYSYVVKDKNNFDKEAARIILEKGLRNNYFYKSREWAYKNIKPRIIADKYIASLGKADTIEYKLHCFNGRVNHIEIERGINHSTTDMLTLDAFDRNFQKLNYTFKFKHSQVELKKPDEWNEMITLSEKLAEGITNVRVDFYNDNGKLYFSEMTFYTWSGMMKFEPEEWDRKLGDMLVLPDKKNIE